MSNLPGIEATELEWLRFFYANIRPALGPADGDIFNLVKRDFTRQSGKKLPPEYALDED